jgi:peptide/nickel transport system substrate-binding protein
MFWKRDGQELTIPLTKIRRGLAAILGITSVCALAAACGSSSGTGASGSSASGAATSGGNLTVGWAEEPDTLNPATTGARDVGPIDENIFDTLIYLNKSNQPTPDLATKWSVSDGGKLYSFTLRQGVKFQDGTPFNAKAAVANFAYITDKTTQSSTSITLLGSCTKAAVTGTYTFTLSCSAPYGPLLAQLGEPYLGMQSPAAIGKYGKNLGSHPVGTGPFKLQSFTPNSSIVLVRNPDYNWAPPALGHNGPASLSKITFDIVTDNQARVSQFTSGQSQFMQETPGVYYEKLKSNGAYTELAVPISGMGIFLPINASRFPTNDVAVRRAIMYAVNTKTVIQVADFGAFTPLSTPLQPGTLGYDAALGSMYPYDPAKASQLLSADGWAKSGGFWTKGGQRLTVDLTAPSGVPEYPLMMQAIQSQLAKVGIEGKVETLGTTAWLASAAAAGSKGGTSLTPSQYVAVDPDALSVWFLPGVYLNWSHYSSPELTSLLQQGGSATSPAQRVSLYQKAQTIIMQQALMLPMHQNEDLTMSAAKLQGVTYSGGGFEFFYLAHLTS